MSPQLAAGIAKRFFGSVIGGIAVSTGFLGVATIWQPYAPADTWADVLYDYIAIGLVGGIAGAIVGAVYALSWSIGLWLKRPKARA
jgi:ABC-type transport system involved in cytochrome c biogenesis permease subunit